MKIAINGTGVAGPTLAYWLKQYGHEPVLFEKSPTLREGGYIIDFWGSGYEVADKMGLFPDLMEDAYLVDQLRTVTATGRTTSTLNARVFRDLTGGRYLSVARSDLSRRIYAACDGVETRFATSVTGIDDQADKVTLTLSDGSIEDFDLLIGADGLHSHVRSLHFGPQTQFERHSGIYVAAFMLSGYQHRDELTYISHTQPGRQVSRVSLRDGKTLFMFIFNKSFVTQDPVGEAAEKATLRDVFKGMGWETAGILARMDEVEDIYFDRVSQIRMPTWSKGRVALLGDAAGCASLLAGEGTGLAMTEAYVLAGELHRASGNHAAAFRAYEERMHSYVTAKQDAALSFAGFFAPKNWFSLIARDTLTNLARIPGLAKLLFGGTFRAKFDLPAYRDKSD